jgi:hypothetical protein
MAMRLNKKQIGFVIAPLSLGAMVLSSCWPSQPNLVIPLADGSNFVLVGTDFGQRLYYGGGRWLRFFCKSLRRNLPPFVHNQPQIDASWYTNGIALHFCGEEPDKHPLQTNWNGSGQLYFLDSSNIEHEVPNHGVNFGTEQRGEIYVLLEENMHWEMPQVRDPELRLSIRETNSSTCAVSTHDFRIKNPAF